ncbi:MAG: AAA family ATPase [Ruminococcus sp.]|nr:AAA family ATPase [Candidatus Copronaster equi]
MSYEIKEEDIYEFARYIGAETELKGDELHFKYCPRCGGGHNGDDKDTFSINIKTGAFCCLRSSCDYHGHFVELARDFDFRLEYETPKIYKQLSQPQKPIKPKTEAIRYLASRGISEKTVERFEVTMHKSKPHTMVFPFFDEAGRLQFIKYRNTAYKRGVTKGAKEWSEKDTMPILFGMKQCTDFSKPLIITEGQIDSLSVAECGFENAVSVPTGALGFTWLTPCWEWICRFKEVIVFGDYENGKITLLDTLKARLPMTVKAIRKRDYLGEKDANDILTHYGKNAIITAIENAEVPKIENVKDLSTVRSVDINALEKIKSGINDIDQVIGGFVMGQVILLTGKRGEGKSTLMSQFISNALDQNESVFAYSGELADFHFKRWLDFQLAGSTNITEKENEYGSTVYSITDATIKQINEWYKGRAFIYDNDYIPEGAEETETLCDTIEKVIKQYGVRLICIDNLMTAMDTVTEQNNLYLAQSNFVGNLKKIAMKYQVAIILVAHPRKSRDDFSNDDVSGSSDITNKVDVVINYSRGSEEGEGMAMITKNRLFGILKTKKDAIRLRYSAKTKRIYSAYDKGIKTYGWVKNAANFDEVEDLPFE